MKKKSTSFSQVVVWENTIVGAGKVTEFVKFMKDNAGVRVRYIKEHTTSNGSNNVFFYVHSEDVMRLAPIRFNFGRMRWLEDVINNGGEVPESLAKLRTW